MSSARHRYPKNWSELARAIKESANWRCQKCGRVCLRPGEQTPNWTKSQRKAYTLQVHHWNRDPSDNRIENLAPLCTGCHLSYHRFGQGNISPGQLSLDL
jgi:hypothetical protein